MKNELDEMRKQLGVMELHLKCMRKRLDELEGESDAEPAEDPAGQKPAECWANEYRRSATDWRPVFFGYPNRVRAYVEAGPDAIRKAVHMREATGVEWQYSDDLPVEPGWYHHRTGNGMEEIVYVDFMPARGFRMRKINGGYYFLDGQFGPRIPLPSEE